MTSVDRSKDLVLLPCPFCGRTPPRGPHWSEDGDRASGNWWIECSNEDCTATLWLPFRSYQAADAQYLIEAWNRRVT